MSRHRSKLRNISEYVLARSVLFVMGWMPKATIPAVARACGVTLNRVLSGRRKVVASNVALAYGDDPSAPDSHELSKKVFTNLCRSFLELTHLPHSRSKMDAMFSCRTPTAMQDLQELIRDDGPVIFAAFHFGAYESLPAIAAHLGIPATSLVRPLDNPYLNRFLTRKRSPVGQRVASNRGGIRELVSDLKSGRSVAVLVDLNMRRKNAIFVNYFGVPAATAPTAALLAWRTGRPLVPCFGHRGIKPMNFEIDICRPLWPDHSSSRENELKRLLQEATSELESRVRETPDQWMWTHRRWKTRPPDENLPT